MNKQSALPFSTTFVSPVTTAAPSAAAAPCSDSTTLRSTDSGKPSSMMKPALRNKAFAPPIARSLSVPCTASDPMSPPGKNSGFTTNESVVNANRQPFTFTIAWSSSRANMGFWKAGRKISFISSALNFPPLPWPSTIVSFAAKGIGQLSSAILFALPDIAFLIPRPHAAGNGNRPRRLLLTKPWERPADSRACNAWQMRDILSAYAILAAHSR